MDETHFFLQFFEHGASWDFAISLIKVPYGWKQICST